MPPQPTTTRRELTPIERAYLVGRHDAGESSRQISHETGVPKSTVIDTIHNAKECGHTNSLPCSRPRKTDIRDDRILRREAKKSARSYRMPLAELQANFQPPLSRSTI
jgi:transposase